MSGPDGAPPARASHPAGGARRRRRHESRRQPGLHRAVALRHHHCRLGDGAVPVVQRDRRSGRGRRPARLRRPPDPELRDDPLSLGPGHPGQSPPRASSTATATCGPMWPSVRRHAHPEAVEAEWRAQIDRALATGIDVTHLDTHMGSALAPEWCDRYVALGTEYGIPVLLTSELAAYGPNNHLAGAGHGPYREAVTEARAAGMPVFDEVLETDFSRPRDRAADYRAMLGSLDTDLVYSAPSIPNAPRRRRDRGHRTGQVPCSHRRVQAVPHSPVEEVARIPALHPDRYARAERRLARQPRTI